jgi:hypothetical protein
MSPNLSTRDFEALSAYLDDQLPERERTRLEARLRTETRLQQALNDLDQTRRVLRAAPRMRAPRNFTLTPEMVPAPAPRFLPLVRFAFALASLMFVLSLAGNFAFAPLGGATTAALPAESVEMQEEAPQALQMEAQEESLAVEEMVEQEDAVGEAEPADSQAVTESAAAAEEVLEAPAEDAARSGEAQDLAGAGETGEGAAAPGMDEAPTLKQQPTNLPEPGSNAVKAAQPAANRWIFSAIIFGLVAAASGGYLLVRRRIG